MGGAASAPWRPSDYGLVTGVPEKLHCAPAEPRAAQTPNNGVFPPPRGSAPSSGAQGLERTRAKPRPPRGPAHLRAPVQASILVCGIFFFGAKSVGHFLGSSTDSQHRLTQGVRGKRGLKSRAAAEGPASPPAAPGRERKKRGRRWSQPPLPPARWRPRKAGQGAPATAVPAGRQLLGRGAPAPTCGCCGDDGCPPAGLSRPPSPVPALPADWPVPPARHSPAYLSAETSSPAMAAVAVDSVAIVPLR